MPIKRTRRDERQRQPKPMTLTERDQAIIRAVQDYRLLRQDQIERLFFGSRSAAQRVLLRLFQHGYLDRRFLPVLAGRSPTLYVLDRRGAELLRSAQGLETVAWHPGMKQVKTEFLAHAAGINDLRIAVTLAAQQAGYDLLRWLGEGELRGAAERVTVLSPAGKRHDAPLMPDSFFTLRTPLGYAHCFVEYDRGTMTSSRFKAKVQAYLAYHRSGAYARRYNARSMRVLTVTSGQKRLENLKAATEAAGGRLPFWFALASELTAETILSVPVWWVAGERERKALIEAR